MIARQAAPRDDTQDGGSAVIEFSVAGLILLIPLIYLVVTLGRLQAASYAVTSAATAASAVTSRAADDAGPPGAARQAAVLALRDHGFADAERSVAIACDPSCTAPRAVVTARVSLDVPLPGAPVAFDRALPAHITVSAHHTDEVAAYGYAP